MEQWGVSAGQGAFWASKLASVAGESHGRAGEQDRMLKRQVTARWYGPRGPIQGVEVSGWRPTKAPRSPQERK